MLRRSLIKVVQRSEWLVSLVGAKENAQRGFNSSLPISPSGTSDGEHPGQKWFQL